jgi:transcription-repair coupling factor (superfamily II helicase)
MRDLEIRGAGNLLGREQSGYINAVGFELYQRLIEEAVEEVRHEALGEGSDGKAKEKREFKLECPLNAYFPEDYMPEAGHRLNFYRELAHAAEVSTVDKVETEVRDRFGRFPPPAQALFAMARMRVLGERIGAAKISLQENRLVVEFPRNGENGRDIKDIVRSVANYPVELSAHSHLMIALPFPDSHVGDESLDYLVGFLRDLAEMPV